MGSSHFCGLELRPSSHCIPKHLNASYQMVHVAKRRIKRRLTLSWDTFLLNIPGKKPKILYRENSIKSMECASQSVFSNCYIFLWKESEDHAHRSGIAALGQTDTVCLIQEFLLMHLTSDLQQPPCCSLCSPYTPQLLGFKISSVTLSFQLTCLSQCHGRYRWNFDNPAIFSGKYTRDW